MAKKASKKEVYRIQGVLADNNIDHKVIAALLDVDPATVSRWCKHKLYPTAEHVYKIAELTKTPLRDMMANEKWPDGDSIAKVAQMSYNDTGVLTSLPKKND